MKFVVLMAGHPARDRSLRCAGAWRVGLRFLPAQQHRSHHWIAVLFLKADYGLSVGFASDGGADARVGDWSKYEFAVCRSC